MGHHRLFYQDAKTIREHLNDAVELAVLIHEKEQTLIQKLHLIDRNRLYVRYGFKSLTGFCRYGLKFSKTQAHRVATQVRRYEPTDNIVDEPLLPSESDEIKSNSKLSSGSSKIRNSDIVSSISQI
jgi:hypothetical protein